MRRPTNLNPLRPSRRLFGNQCWLRRLINAFWRWC